METPHLWVGTCSLRMKTPLRGRSGGHTGAAPTISHVAPCPKVASEQFADGLNRKRLLANSSPTDKTRNDCRRTVCRWTKSKKGCWRIVRRWTKSRKGCWRIVRRWTKSRKGWRQTVRRWTKSKKGCWRTVCRRTKSRKGCWRIVRRRTKMKKVAGEQVRRWTKTREVAWQRGLMEVGRGGACVPARVALQGRIHR